MNIGVFGKVILDEWAGIQFFSQMLCSYYIENNRASLTRSNSILDYDTQFAEGTGSGVHWVD